MSSNSGSSWMRFRVFMSARGWHGHPDIRCHVDKFNNSAGGPPALLFHDHPRLQHALASLIALLWIGLVVAALP